MSFRFIDANPIDAYAQWENQRPISPQLEHVLHHTMFNEMIPQLTTYCYIRMSSLFKDSNYYDLSRRSYLKITYGYIIIVINSN